MERWSWSRRAACERSRSSSSPWRTLAVERRNSSDGRPVISATTPATSSLSRSTRPSQESSTLPRGPAKTFSRYPCRPSCSNSSRIRGSPWLPQVRRSRSAGAVEVGSWNNAISSAVWTVDLPDSLAPRRTVSPVAGARSRSACCRMPWMWSLVTRISDQPPVGGRRGAADRGRALTVHPRWPGRPRSVPACRAVG